MIKNEEEAQAVRARLLQVHADHLVCKPDGKLVIEGYPRSSNSYTVYMLREASKGLLNIGHIGHHTHDVRNLALARFYHIPQLILIRNPEDAILSFYIYANCALSLAMDRYQAFYEGAFDGGSDSVVATFEEATTDFDRVIRKVRRISGINIPDMEDYAAIRSSALAYVKQNADRLEPEIAVRQIASPHAEREILKDEVRSQVVDAVRSRKEIWDLYEHGLKLAKVEA